MVLKEAFKEEEIGIIDDAVLGHPPVSQGHMGLSHLFPQEASVPEKPSIFKRSW